MILKKFEATNLNGRPTIALDFHRDLNIITGKNGSGKTTALKILWLIISGNVEWIWPEITFDTLDLETDQYIVRAKRETPTDARQTVVAWQVIVPDDAKKPEIVRVSYEAPRERRNGLLEKVNSRIMTASRGSSSLFFPTFRQIEGGFGMTSPSRTTDAQLYFSGYASPDGAMGELSRRLSVRGHRFVASISTRDIVNNLTTRYANVSEQLNTANKELSEIIIESIHGYQESEGVDQLTQARAIIDSIRERIGEHAQLQAKLLKPFSTLSDLIAQILQHKGIRITANLTIGDQAADAIESDVLSSGEKQMLSFLAYNAFEDASVIFIDEPEISLHVDWQRILFPTLFAQGVANQFIITTHSPFIFSKYSDKEVVLDSDRGFSRADLPREEKEENADSPSDN